MVFHTQSLLFVVAIPGQGYRQDQLHTESRTREDDNIARFEIYHRTAERPQEERVEAFSVLSPNFERTSQVSHIHAKLLFSAPPSRFCIFCSSFCSPLFEVRVFEMNLTEILCSFFIHQRTN